MSDDRITREVPCGHKHTSLQDALLCVEQHKNSAAVFGHLGDGVNLWWGDKWTPRLTNLGYVIGLRNLDDGLWWRLDYDEKKGAHINQANMIGDAGWAKVYHPIRFGFVAPHATPSYNEDYWVRHWWTTWTRLNESKRPQGVREKMERYGVIRL